MIAVAEADQVGLRSHWLYVSAVLMSVFWMSADPYQSLTSASLAYLLAALVTAVLGVGALPAGGHAGGGMLVAMFIVGAVWAVIGWGPTGVGGWLLLCVVVLCLWSQRGFGRRRVVLTHCGILLCIQAVVWLLLTRASALVDESLWDGWYVERLASFGWSLRPHDSPWIHGTLSGWQLPTLAVIQTPFFLLLLTAVVYWMLVFESHWLRITAAVLLVLTAMVVRYVVIAFCCSEFSWWRELLAPTGLLVYGLFVAWSLPRIAVGSSRIAQLFGLRWRSLPSVSAALAGVLVGVLIGGHLPSGHHSPKQIHALVDRSEFVALTTVLDRMGSVNSVEDWSAAPSTFAPSDLIVLHPNRAFTVDELVNLQEAVEQGASLLVLHDRKCTAWVQSLVNRFGLHVRPRLPVDNEARRIERRAFAHPILHDLKQTTLPASAWNVVGATVGDSVQVRRALAGPCVSPLAGVSWGRGRVLVAADADWFRAPEVFSESQYALLQGSLGWVTQPGWPPYQGAFMVAMLGLIATGVTSVLLWKPAHHLQMSVSFLLFAGLTTGAIAASLGLLAPRPPNPHPDDIVVSAYHTSIDLPGAPIGDRVNHPSDIVEGRVRPIDGTPVLQAIVEAGHLPRIVGTQQQLGNSRSKAIWVIAPLYYPPEPLVQQLRDYVRKGGTLVVVLTDHTLTAVANQWLLSDQLKLTEQRATGPLEAVGATPSLSSLRPLQAVSFRVLDGGVPSVANQEGLVACAALELGRGKIVALGVGDEWVEQGWIEWLANTGEIDQQ